MQLVCHFHVIFLMIPFNNKKKLHANNQSLERALFIFWHSMWWLVNTQVAIQECFIHIFCKKKLRFPILIFLTEEIKICTNDVSCKSVLNWNIRNIYLQCYLNATKNHKNSTFSTFSTSNMELLNRFFYKVFSHFEKIYFLRTFIFREGYE